MTIVCKECVHRCVYKRKHTYIKCKITAKPLKEDQTKDRCVWFKSLEGNE